MGQEPVSWRVARSNAPSRQRALKDWGGVENPALGVRMVARGVRRSGAGHWAVGVECNESSEIIVCVYSKRTLAMARFPSGVQ